MFSLIQRIHLLKNEPPEAVEKILIESLRHALPEELAAICQRLIRLNRPRALAAVICHLDDLDAGTWLLLESRKLSITEAARTMFPRSSSGNLIRLIELIERRLDDELAVDLANQLPRLSEPVATRAAEAILVMTRASLGDCELAGEFTGGSGGQWDNKKYRERIDRAVAVALESFRQHRRQPIVLAATLLAASPGPAMSRILDDPDHPSHFALRGVVENLDEPLVRMNLLRWANVKGLGRAVNRWLHKLHGPRQYADLLTQGHLLMARSIRRALAGVDRPARCLPDLETACEMSPETQAWLPLLAGTIRVSTQTRIRYFGTLSSLPDPRGRLKALLGLIDYRATTVAKEIRRFTSDPEPRIARIAARHMLAHPESNVLEDLTTLESSPHDSIALAARRRRAGLRVDRFMKDWLYLPESDRLVASHQLLATHRKEFISVLKGVMRSESRHEMLACLSLIRRMRLAKSFESQLIGHSFNPDPRIASAIVSTMADAGSTSCLNALRAALHYDDPRVQANAVEALLRLKAPETIDLVSFLTESRNNRSRANAVWAMFRARSDEATNCLSRMLHDPEPLHRVSGIWVARRMRVASLVADLQQIAQNDRFSEVRFRAGRTAQYLNRQAVMATR
ncbi:MAG: HEAT repeat domain-containing protein [Planctomycetes bacterium]|nr:HEAT repeat domain-containing protein [Planctomycetota bacterium]